jgi:hypothetical protein
MNQKAVYPNDNLKAVSIGILVFSQMLYLIFIYQSLSLLGAAVLGLGLAADSRYMFWAEPIAAAILIRAWALVICQIAFPFVAIIAGCFAWHFYKHRLYRRAIFITLLPLFLIIFSFLLFRWDPYVLHW